MKITRLRLKNFKRFTDLTIDLGDAQSPKLVLLIGANGSGKSAVFDAMEIISAHHDAARFDFNEKAYYLKNDRESIVTMDFENGGTIQCKLGKNRKGTIEQSNTRLADGSFYGRSAVRYVPRITQNIVGPAISLESNEDKPRYYIDFDTRFNHDVFFIVKDIVESVFRGINISNSEDALVEIRQFLKRINEALVRIFGGENDNASLVFLQLSPPVENTPINILFKKGNSEINYDLLSSGEKEVINVLFYLFVRLPHYQDTIFFFDELDAHLHTSLQYKMLQEIVENWIPENCQLWTASHSLGFIQYARQSESAAIIDFDNFDFDIPVELAPQKSQEVFDIAVPKEALTLLFKDKIKVFCEAQNALLFNTVGLESTLFLGEADKTGVFLRAENDPANFGIIDRDYLADDEVERLENKLPNLALLRYYCFENYLYHPENLAEAYHGFDAASYAAKITAEKNKHKNDIISKIRNDRRSYIFCKRSEYKIDPNRLEPLFEMLESNDFETFYKVFNMKSRGNLSGLHNLKAASLVKTKWFGGRLRGVMAGLGSGV